ncbi:MAG: GH116 family glycosyl hydrolase [Verrucomicrobia bacterium]|nr:GH116 family glycosyl hydrolase [Verrucomicrobiota bacterium]
MSPRQVAFTRVHPRTPLPQLPHRRRQSTRPDLHQPPCERPGRPHRHRPGSRTAHPSQLGRPRPPRPTRPPRNPRPRLRPLGPHQHRPDRVPRRSDARQYRRTPRTGRLRQPRPLRPRRPQAEPLLTLPPENDLTALFANPPAPTSQPAPQGAAPAALADGGLLRVTRTLRPGERVTVPFAVAWHFPNLFRDGQRVGNYYARRFPSAVDVARYVRLELDRLTRDTRQWRDTYYDSTLPWWLLDRLHSTAANLATTTCQWWQNGRFWAWEGGGCCHGTCGHVWNYAHTLARLFPELERSVREHQDFAEGIGLQENGAIGFRGEGWSLWAGDSQGGYILKALREHQCAPDDTFLNRNWRAIKRATQFLIREDANGDGLIEAQQHQTYDENYFGANTFVGALYLGALRAAETMALEVGDTTFARQCREIFEAGSKLSVTRLFNGEYFIQEVDLAKHPDWQYGDGCLADQLFGQGWAHQVGLGYLYPDSTVRQALASIWKYCWAPDITAQNTAHPPERWFASKGDAGLFTCTWPRNRHLGPKSTRYRDELWTGIEYQVAGHMAWEGLLTEALALCRAVHDRYHPRRFNPWNEIECGDHYARALASWSVLTGLAGFSYHGPRGQLGFAPASPPTTSAACSPGPKAGELSSSVARPGCRPTPWPFAGAGCGWRNSPSKSPPSTLSSRPSSLWQDGVFPPNSAGKAHTVACASRRPSWSRRTRRSASSSARSRSENPPPSGPAQRMMRFRFNDDESRYYVYPEDGAGELTVISLARWSTISCWRSHAAFANPLPCHQDRPWRQTPSNRCRALPSPAPRSAPSSPTGCAGGKAGSDRSRRREEAEDCRGRREEAKGIAPGPQRRANRVPDRRMRTVECTPAASFGGLQSPVHDPAPPSVMPPPSQAAGLDLPHRPQAWTIVAVGNAHGTSPKHRSP